MRRSTTCSKATALASGARVVVEEFLAGEASFIVMVDGKNVLPMATCWDHTSACSMPTFARRTLLIGMGAYSPAPRS